MPHRLLRGRPLAVLVHQTRVRVFFFFFVVVERILRTLRRSLRRDLRGGPGVFVVAPWSKELARECPARAVARVEDRRLGPAELPAVQVPPQEQVVPAALERSVKRDEARVGSKRRERQLHHDDAGAVHVEPVGLVLHPRGATRGERDGAEELPNVRRVVARDEELLGGGVFGVHDCLVGGEVHAGSETRAGSEVDELEPRFPLAGDVGVGEDEVVGLDVPVHEARAVHGREVLEQLAHHRLRHLELHRGIAPGRAVAVEERLGDARRVIGLRHILRERAVALELPHEPQPLLRDDSLALVEVRLVGGDAERSEKVCARPARVARHPVVHPRLHLLKLRGSLHGELRALEDHVPRAPRVELPLVNDAEGTLADLARHLDVGALVLGAHRGHPHGDAPRAAVTARRPLGPQRGNHRPEDPVRRHQSRAHRAHRRARRRYL